MLRPYEAIVIVKSETPEKKLKELFTKNEKIISDFKGKLNSVETWGRRKLANDIDGERAGLYFHTTFEGEADAIREMERTMKNNEDVLRFMHVRLEDGTDLNKHLEGFKERIQASLAKEKEREAKFQKRAANRVQTSNDY